MPKITLIELQKKNKERCNLYIDGEYHCPLSLEVVMKHGLKVGQEVELSSFDALAAEDEQKKATDTALKYLAFARTRAEVEKKLREKGFAEETVTATIEKLLGWGYVNDEEYALAFAREKARAGKSRREIEYALGLKGIARQTAQAAVEALPEGFETQAALAYAKKKCRNGLDVKERQRIFRALCARGFAREVVQSVLETIDGEEQLDEG